MARGRARTGGRSSKPAKLSETAENVLGVVNEIIAVLVDVATKADLAKAAQLPSANLARTLRGENNPRPATMAKLVTGASALLEAHRKALSKSDYERLARALVDLPVGGDGPVGGGGLAAPGGPLPLDSAVYVQRTCDDSVTGENGFVSTRQTFEITGTVATGRSSLVSHFVQAAGERGGDILEVDLVSRAAAADSDSRWWLLVDLVDQICVHVRESGADVAAALDQVDTTSITNATQANATVVAALEAWSQVPGIEPVLVVDGINFLDVDVVDAFVSACRDTDTVQCALVNASPRRTEQARRIKSFGRSTTLPVADTLWFTGPRHGGTIDHTEIGTLARAYAPDRRAKAARLVDAVALEAWQLFGGQPRLTHQYIHDNARQDIGMQGRVERVLQRRSPYQTHIDLLQAALDSTPVEGAGTTEVRRPAEDRPAPVELLLRGIEPPESQPMSSDLEKRADEIGVLDPLARRGLPCKWHSWFYCASLVLPDPGER